MKKCLGLLILALSFQACALEQAQPEMDASAPLGEISPSPVQATSPAVEVEQEVEKSVHQELPQTRYHKAKKPSKGCVCAKKCFNHCKMLDKAVDGCQVRGSTPVSFRIQCECRDLNAGEQLPSFYQAPKECLIKPAQSYVDQDK